MDAAFEVVESLIKEECLDNISGCLMGKKTYVMSPSKTPELDTNALSATFAHVIADELEIDVGYGVYQVGYTKRDRSSFWPRFANPVEFYGAVEAGADYVLVDDILTAGGTLAALRALIESQGGRVICMSTLAARVAEPTRIAIGPRLLSGLRARYGTPLDVMLKEELGYGLDGLTHQEAGTLNGEPSVEQVRARIVRARHPANARANSS